MLNRFITVNWYYIHRGQKSGPLDEAQLDELVRTGRLTPDALVWQEGMTEWRPYGHVRAMPAPGAPPMETGRVSCALCSQSFAPDEVITFDGAWVCAACKPQLVQRVREGLSVGHGSGNAWRDGDLVVTIPGSTLTGRCVKCNGVESLSHTSGALHWHPPWVYALLLLTPIAYLLALMATQKSAWVAVSVCRHHRKQRSTLTVASWLIMLVALICGAAAASFSSVVLLVIAGSVLAGGAIAFRRQWDILWAARIEGDYLWLRGCGREFVDALPEFNRQRSTQQQTTAEPSQRKT